MHDTLPAVLTLLTLFLSACAGPTSDITVAIPPHIASDAANALTSMPPTRIELREVREPQGTGLLPGRIGERKPIGNISMGLVSVSPPVGRLLTDMLRAELITAGHQLSNGEAKVTITGEVRRFALHTDVTAVYWDVIVDAAVTVTASAQARSETGNYTARHTERTYVWPGEEVIARAVRACVAGLARQFREDSAIAAVLSAS
jgi:uncharacterized lipoprotein YajG